MISNGYISEQRRQRFGFFADWHRKNNAESEESTVYFVNFETKQLEHKASESCEEFEYFCEYEHYAHAC